MKRAALIAAALLASSAIAGDGWAPVATGAAGDWDIRVSTAQRQTVAGVEVYIAVVRRTHTQGGQAVANLYNASLPGAQCVAAAGTLRLTSLTGELMAEDRWRAGEARAGAMLAKAVCAAVAGGRR